MKRGNNKGAPHPRHDTPHHVNHKSIIRTAAASSDDLVPTLKLIWPPFSASFWSTLLFVQQGVERVGYGMGSFVGPAGGQAVWSVCCLGSRTAWMDEETRLSTMRPHSW